MSRPDLYADDVEALMQAHESRLQTQRVLDPHRYPAGNPTAGAFSVLGWFLGVLLLVILLLVVVNIPALYRLAVEHGPAIVETVSTLTRALRS